MRRPHPDFTTLFALASGRLSRELGESVREHLSACASCASERETAERLLETVRADTLTEPPATVLEAALALWKTAGPAAERSARVSRGVVRRAVQVVKAILTFDSLAAPASVAVRSSERTRRTARARRLVYRAGDFDIELTVERPRAPRERPSIRGQLLARRAGPGVPAEAAARLGKTGGRIAKLALDPHGAFSSGPLARGRYRVTIDVGRARLVVTGIEVK